MLIKIKKRFPLFPLYFRQTTKKWRRNYVY